MLIILEDIYVQYHNIIHISNQSSKEFSIEWKEKKRLICYRADGRRLNAGMHEAELQAKDHCVLINGPGPPKHVYT